MSDPWERLRSLVDEFAVDDESLEHLLDQATLWISWSVPNAPNDAWGLCCTSWPTFAMITL